MIEHKIQVLVVNFLKLKMPPSFLMYAIPNGGHRDPRVGVKLKAEGVTKGMPDLHIPIARDGYHSLYVEMKSEKGRVSKEQNEIHRTLRLHGNQVIVCRSFEEAVRSIILYYDEKLYTPQMAKTIETWEQIKS